jgi:SAM-dependent methyltransferase
MAHKEQSDYIASLQSKFPLAFKGERTLEIGSLNINGTVRNAFTSNEYVGVDVGSGTGVNVVISGHEYDSDKPFDCCISCECFEHNPFWKETFLNMVRLCASGGLVIFTCATTGRPEHGTERSTPQDSPLTIAKGWSYYLNLTEEDFQAIFNFDALFTDWQFSVNEQACDLYFYGVKR